MKKFYLLIILSVVSITTGLYAQNGWYVVSQLTNNNITVKGIDFTSGGQTGYLVANAGTTGYVFYTSDGGSSWSQDTSFSNTLNAVDISPSGDVYVVGASGKIYKKSTSGGSWVAQTSGTTNELKDIQFVTSTTGYAVGISGILRKTTNGGTSWTNPIVGSGYNYDYNSVYFTSASNGVIVGTYNFFQGFAIKTVSGGQYWGAPVTFPSYLNKVVFTSATTGYAVGNGGVIYKSTNAGGSWSLKTSGVTAELHDVSFISDSIGYAVGNNGTIIKTINAGTSWQTQPVPLVFNLNCIFTHNANTAWAAGDSSQVLKTNTGGINLAVSVPDTVVYCSGYKVMHPVVSYNGTGTIQYSWAANPLLSSTTIQNPVAGPITQSTKFYVTVTDGTLTANDSCTISVTTLPTDSICLVSVMDSTNDNIIVFEKHVQGPIQYYKIYKESTVANVYDSIGFIPADSAGLFIDTAVNPMVQAYRYKISSVDSCGNETNLSNAHKTIHLTINQGLPGQWNLIWNNYEGVFINTYRIWRSDSLGQNWALIDSVAGNMTSYTDLNPPPGPIHYQIEIISSYMCLPYAYKAQTNYNTSRSNRANTGAPPTISADFSANPTTGKAPLTVNFSDASSGQIDAWFWDFGDGDTALTKNPTHTYTNVGTYNVTLYIHGGSLNDSTTKMAFIDVISSIEDIDLNKVLKVYPNPATAGNSLFVEANGAIIAKVEIFDIVGKQVYSGGNLKTQKAEIKPDSNLKGVFFMKITTAGGQTVQRKLIIK